MADIKLIGAVGVKVRAVTDGVRRDTERGFRRELAGFNPDVRVDAKVRADTRDARREIRSLEQEARNLRLNPRVDVDTRGTEELLENVQQLHRGFDALKRQRLEMQKAGDPFGAWAKNLGHFSKSIEHQRGLMRGMAQAYKGLAQEIKDSGFAEAQRAIDKMNASQQRSQQLSASRLQEVEHLETRIARLQKQRADSIVDFSVNGDVIRGLHEQVGLLRERARALRDEERQVNRLSAQWGRLTAAQRSAVQGVMQADENVALQSAEDEFKKWETALSRMTTAELRRAKLIQKNEADIAKERDRLNAELANASSEREKDLLREQIQRLDAMKVGERELAALQEELGRRLQQSRLNRSEAFQAHSINQINARADAEYRALQRRESYEKDAHVLRLMRTEELNDAQRSILETQQRLERSFGAIDQKMLDAIYRDLALGGDRAVRARLDLLKFTSKVELDDESVKEAKRKAERLREEIEADKAMLEIEPRGLLAMAAQLKYASRDRMVNFYVRVNETSLAVAEGMLKSLAGLNTTRSIGMALQDLATNFDNVAVKTSLVSTVVGNLINILGSATSSIFAAAGDLLQVTGILATVPAAAAAATSAIFLAKMGWQDFAAAAKGDEEALARLPELAREAATEFTGLYDKMQDQVQARYWQGIGDSMLGLARNVLPEVRRGLTESAEAAGRFTAGIFDSFNKIALNGDMRVMFRNLSGMFDQMAGAAEPLFDAINRIGLRGSEYLPRFGEWVTEISEGFRDWTIASDEAGKFNKWIEQGVTQLKNLGRMGADAVRIVQGLGKIGLDAGSQGLTGWADGLSRVAKTVNSEPFRSRLTNILKGANDGASRLGDGFDDLTDTIGRSSETIRELLIVAGELGGGVLSGIAQTIGGMKFQAGVLEGFEGMQSMVEQLQPGFRRLGDLIGSTMSIAGSTLSGLSPVINSIVGSLADMAENVEAGFKSFSPTLIQQLTGTLSGLGSVLGVVTSGVGGLLEAFSSLPGAVQSVIVAFGAFQLMRGHLGGFIEKAFDRTPLRRWREELELSRRLAGQSIPVGGLSNYTVVMDRARQSTGKLRTELGTLKGAGRIAARGLGGVVTLLGGPWGVILGAAAAGLAIFAQRSAEAKARQDELAASLDQVTGAATEQTVSTVFDQLIATEGGIKGWVDGMDKNIRSVSDIFDDMGISVGEASKMIAEGGPAARDFAGDLNHLASMANSMSFEELEREAERIGFIGDISELSVADIDVLNRKVQEIAPVLFAEGDKIRAREDALGLKTAEEDAVAAFDSIGEGVDQFNDKASTAERRIAGLSDAFKALNGDQTAEGFRRMATRAFESVGEELDRLNKSDGIDWDGLFNQGEFDTSVAQGLQFAELAEQQAEGYLAKLSEFKEKLDTGVISNEQYQESIANVFEQIGLSGDRAAEQLGLTGEQAKQFAEAWEASMPDDETWEIMLTTRGSDMAAADIALLKEQGMDLTHEEYMMELDANGDGAITTIERTQELGRLFSGQIFLAFLDGDDQGMQDAYLRAANSGIIWDGSEWISSLGADGKPAADAIAAARILGIKWDGEKWVADVDANNNTKRPTDEAKRNINSVHGKTVSVGATVHGFGSLDALRNAIAGIKSKTVTVAAKVQNALGSTWNSVWRGFGNEDGSLPGSPYRPKPVRFFENGGLNAKPQSAHIAKDGSYVVYAEKGTGDEAFIPLAASKRQRSLAIWKETGHRLNAFQDGGFSSPAAPQLPPINITNHYPVAEKTSVTVNRALQLASSPGLEA